MKAVQIHDYGDVSQLKLEEVSDPTPGAGEVLVRMAATSVNPFDLTIRRGAAKTYYPQPFPAILGRDLAGKIVALGTGVTGFTLGDRVMGVVAHTYAELVAAKATDLCLIPSGLEDVQAAAIPLVATTGAELIEQAGNVSKGQTVLVTGALGGVGRTAAFAAKQRGAKVIAGVRGAQLEEAKQVGADQVMALDDDAAIQALPPLDVVADTVGHEPTLKLLPKIKRGGTLASVVGAPAEAKDRDLRVATLIMHSDPARLQQLAVDVAAGRLRLPVGRVLKLADIQEAHRLAEQGRSGKIVLVP
jgi:NADPH:quinone reductase-like Zn-dependent oxidoreductase